MGEAVRLEPLTTDDGVRLAVKVWDAGLDAAVFFYMHGIESHMEWFEEAGSSLRAAGHTVYAMDRRGSGKSGGTPGHAPSFDRVVEDMHQLVVRIRAERRRARLHGVGLSLGANFQCALAIRHPEDLDGIVAVGPGFTPRVGFPVHKQAWILLHALFSPLTTFPIPIQDHLFTRNPEAIEFIRRDPLRRKSVTARFYLEVLRMKRFLFQRAGEIAQPICLLLAGEDAIIDNEGCLEWQARTGSRKRKAWIYEGCLHSLQFELPPGSLARAVAGCVGEGPDEEPTFRLQASGFRRQAPGTNGYPFPVVHIRPSRDP